MANAISLPFKKGSFDTVLFLNALHHLAVPRIDQTYLNAQVAIHQISLVLKSNGVFLLSDDCPSWLVWRCYSFLYEPMAVIWNVFGKPLPYFFPVHQEINFLKENGFLIEEIKEIPWGKRVYLPIFPSFSPPGWLLGIFWRFRLFVAKRR